MEPKGIGKHPLLKGQSEKTKILSLRNLLAGVVTFNGSHSLTTLHPETYLIDNILTMQQASIYCYYLSAQS